MNKEYKVRELWVVDFDRTLGDVEAAMRRFSFAAGKFGIRDEEIQVAQKKVENDGGSFDPLGVLVKKGVDLEKFAEEFKRVNVEILYPDARVIMGKLIKSRIPHLVLTYGVNEIWQRLKIEASGYAGEWKMMNNPAKGKEITNWQNKLGRYEVELKNKFYIAESICLIDDKAIAFESLLDNCRGYLIQRGEALASQIGSLPENVVKINSLAKINLGNF